MKLIMAQLCGICWLAFAAWAAPGPVESDWIQQDQRWTSPAAGERPFALAHTRDVLNRAESLRKRLEPTADTGNLGPLAIELKELDRRLAALEKAGAASVESRQAVYLDARRLMRSIVLCNPLLNIDKLLFIKRNDAKGVYHMCDQYYGFNAVPGGGVFVLENAMSPQPHAVDLLENAVVEKGRLAGKKLAGGSFLSPNISYDGKTIVFAWSAANGKDLHWTTESCYHIFKVNADGSHLVQLTDGPWDDFDPCFLPNGRLAFISERRGGFLRCGRHCPVYTLFGMASDGSDIICLSQHETHEWHPSVNNEGMIVYTRWDYIDRDSDVAHHIWTCYPDGRDPRSYHGNYPLVRESRPWMEMNIRAIPDSPLYVATAAAHHGHAFGSLVLIDLRLRDDNATSQLVRLTPEVPFPESEKNLMPIRDSMQYGTAWPLSEEDFLCVYDANAKRHGIYWIDRFGNKELIYRDDTIACLSPMPLRARPMPPVIPSQTTQTAEDLAKAGGKHPQATITVMNVYESDANWPAGTKIKALRVIQVLPKTTAPPNQPRIGCANQTNARAVLGTVPVEEDGSACFEAPVGKEIYFQALDGRGLAVQSMRSGTYVHPGEQLTCQGCHEDKHQSPRTPANPPLALRRAPSKISPDVEGASPFSYVRLVQPALDRNCVSCHQQKKAIDLTGVLEGKYGFSRSYQNLTKNYGFYFDVGNGSIKTGVHGGSRSIPGQFGASASKLLAYLSKSHHGVTLSDEDFHRITLWLDCNSEFLGAYENAAAQARGEIVKPSMD